LARGDDLFGARDVISARLFYERAAEAGDGEGALRMAMSFDPRFIAQAGLQRRLGDRAQALNWYERASELGNPNAKNLVARLNQE
jgi:TPR repeat protein